MFKRGDLATTNTILVEPARDPISHQSDHNKDYIKTPPGTVVEILEPLKGWDVSSAWLVWVPTANEYIGFLSEFLEKI